MTIFDEKKDTKSVIGVMTIVRRSIDGENWLSTTDLYKACSKRVSRDLLHEALKQMLFRREIVMRVINGSGRGRNEFKRHS